MVNAFWLDHDIDQAARWLVDAHVTSSIVECAVVLTTSVQMNGHPERDDLYFGFPDHPLTDWARHSHANWGALYRYTEAAHEEWRYRWQHPADERHDSWTTVRSLDRDRLPDLDWTGDDRTDPPQLTGDWTAPDFVDAYRFYYANEKRHLFEWSRDRDRPPWIEAYTLDPRETDSG